MPNKTNMSKVEQELETVLQEALGEVAGAKVSQKIRALIDDRVETLSVDLKNRIMSHVWATTR